jgi:hypothetical protein
MARGGIFCVHSAAGIFLTHVEISDKIFVLALSYLKGDHHEDQSHEARRHERPREEDAT